MKKHFITGLVILLPLALTLAIIFFVINVLTEPFVGIFQAFMDRYDILEKSFLFFKPHQVQMIVSQLVILILLFAVTTLLGAVARWFFIRYLIKMGDYIIHRIPVFSTLYRTFKDVVNTLFAKNKRAFKQVVFVPFPTKESYSVGVVSAEGLPFKTPLPTEHLVSVFIPTAPNPMSGFVVLLDAKELIYTDMKVEDALKYVISCGVIKSNFQQITPSEAAERLKGES